MNYEEKIAKRYAQDELKDNHGKVEDIVAAAFLNGIDYAEHHPRWTSVEDELPPKESEYEDFSTEVLATDGNGVYKGLYRSAEFLSGWFTDDLWALDNITHWMPLPKPPEHIAGISNKTTCPDCFVVQYPPCGKGIPCCKCHEEGCNSRQPCPKKGGEQ